MVRLSKHAATLALTAIPLAAALAGEVTIEGNGATIARSAAAGDGVVVCLSLGSSPRPDQVTPDVVDTLRGHWSRRESR
ncbi:MAG: hypothetical protein WAO61_00245 [Solirubrobacterales bacterium]